MEKVFQPILKKKALKKETSINRLRGYFKIDIYKNTNHLKFIDSIYILW